jgi:electron transfer flavoprotein beta subunit
VSVEAAGVRLRRAGLHATLTKGNTAITVASTPAAARRVRILTTHPYRPRPRELPAPVGSALRRTLELTGALAQRTPPTVVGPLSPDEAASELLAYLRRWGYAPADVSAGYELAARPARTEPKKPVATRETGIKR